MPTRGDMSLVFKTAILSHRLKNVLGLRSLFLDDVNPEDAVTAMTKMLGERFVGSFKYLTRCRDDLSLSMISPAVWRQSVWVRDGATRITTDLDTASVLGVLRDQRLCSA